METKNLQGNNKFQSKWGGFVLACVGSAVGMANVWGDFHTNLVVMVVEHF